MSHLRSTIEFHVPEPTLRRLPWYLAFAKLALQQGESFLSSTRIAKSIAVDPSMVAKDLSFVKISGRTRVGYDVNELVAVLEHFLGFTDSHQAYLFGVGNLGGALMHDNGLQQFGMEIKAGFDVRQELTGTSINHIPIHHIDKFAELQQQTGIHIGILTVPVDKAQDVSDIMVKGGIKAIWNFTPYRIVVPDNVIVQNTSIYAHLAVMYNRLNALKELDL
ncbi:MAG: redox-sensing transcriptional repressor Rex [Bacteroidales bacterium]|jgi:redox-sensing transcriptional repressor|nr:redox-sensing transcriptional repressor Rex [Bacteroidales bacterium]